MSVDSPRTPPADWADALGRIQELVLAHQTRAGATLSEAATTTLRVNTELVPQRGMTLVRGVEALGGPEGVFGDRDVIEAGSGYGALAAWLVLEGGARHVLACDIRADFVEGGERLAVGLGITDRLRFEVASMAELEGTAVADVVLCNNALYYLDRRAQRRALRTFRRVLRPGGILIVYQANRWRRDDPLTRAPWIHLAPPWLARPIERRWSVKGSHDRIAPLSPPGLRARLLLAGYRGIRQGGARSGTAAPGWRTLVGGFFLTVARNPAGRRTTTRLGG